MHLRLFSHYIAVVGLFAIACSTSVDTVTKFRFVEATVSQAHEAMRVGTLTSRELVEGYLDRIRQYDQSSLLNSIVVTNPDALAEADALDEEFERTGELRPLHGIPIIVKDNYDTIGLQTAAGSEAMKGSTPPDDAFQVARLKEAGAIVLAKSNMAEWAFSPYVTESSLAGTTRNPYDLERVPAGSSGGTAASVAASFGMIGLGTDTGNSIRGPSSHNMLVGIRSTKGLTSIDGIIPLYARNDVGGPMARTVEDAVRVLELIAGNDPADPITKRSSGHIPESYLEFLNTGALKGVRIGVFRRYIDAEATDPEIRTVMARAISDLMDLGAKIVDPVDIPDYPELTANLWCNTFQHDVNLYLASLGDAAPHRTLASVVESGRYAPYIESRLRRALEITEAPDDRDPICADIFSTPANIAFREAVSRMMDENELDAFIYPTWSNPPRMIGDMESPAGDNSQHLSPHTGFPAITVPMGVTYDGLPAGVTFMGREYSEPLLIGFAYSYEQATRHRKPPARFRELQ